MRDIPVVDGGPDDLQKLTRFAVGKRATPRGSVSRHNRRDDFPQPLCPSGRRKNGRGIRSECFTRSAHHPIGEIMQKGQIGTNRLIEIDDLEETIEAPVGTEVIDSFSAIGIIIVVVVML
jgi:hypothetical protein